MKRRDRRMECCRRGEHFPSFAVQAGLIVNTCVLCDAVLPLGPARLDGEHTAAVAIELRAAEIAGSVDHWFGMTDHERNGWLSHAFTVARVRHVANDAAQSAGYLARAIAEHDRGGSP